MLATLDSATTRFRTCHAAVSAVEEIHGVSAVDATRTYVDLHPNAVG